jgi:aminoglycoside phosphotransferase (APT) family kinase protein
VTTAASLSGEELDALRSPALHERLPGLRAALDADAMAVHLQTALGIRRPVDRVSVRHASYVGQSCVIRYDLEIAGRQSVVTGRAFPAAGAAMDYVAERLEPLADRVRGRFELAEFEHPAGLVRALALAVSVFPVDGELPTLLEASDAAAMLAMLRETVPSGLSRPLTVHDCKVQLAHYGRQHRCVLRYEMQAAAPGGELDTLVVYGKVGGVQGDGVVTRVIEALRSHAQPVVALPRVLGHRPDLRLTLFEELPGVPRIAQLVRARVSRTMPGEDLPDLAAALATCAAAAAALHTCDTALGRVRPVPVETAALREMFALAHPISPALSERLEGWLTAAEARAVTSAPLPFVLSHGDFSYTQLIFDGGHAGLVDFDTICQAEPALDLGHFLAYLELAGRKAGAGATGVVTALGEDFFSAYAAARNLREPEIAALVERSAVYETFSLLRLAAHSWQKLKPRRLRLVLDALDHQFSKGGWCDEPARIVRRAAAVACRHHGWTASGGGP